jgi:G protein-coupled receptor Mth (Methuselah protein)
MFEIFDCYIFGVLTHYFYLAFFVWSNTMAYDLYRTLNRLDPKSQAPVKMDPSDDRRKFLIFSLYSWVTPLLLVAILIGKQFFQHRMSYGYRICFVSTNVDLFVFFVAPVALILLVNFYFLTICIFMIRKVDKSTGKYLNKENTKENKQRLILFIKLFILTGIKSQNLKKS